MTTTTPSNDPPTSNASDAIDVIEIRPGQYFDSVRLMLVSRAAEAVDGVVRALVAMGTELNHQLAGEMGFSDENLSRAGVNDLIIAIRAGDRPAVDAARAAIEDALSARHAGGPGLQGDGSAGLLAARAARTIESAGHGADLAVISVPGPHAFVEAMAALNSGLHVMLFSDNVSIEHEVLLKKRAEELDRLVMGPDCGTAILGGLGLGFANVVQPGPVSLVGASGTGIQQICALLDAAGVGVRHAIGTGSRDLSAEVGGASALRALHALDRDPGTEIIVVLSKPPAPEVAKKVEAAAAALETPTVLAFLGRGETTLESATLDVLARLGHEAPTFPCWLEPAPAPAPATTNAAGERDRPVVLRGLFSGGSLRDEARSIAAGELGAIATDEPTDDATPGHATPGHAMIDYGDDIYTRGRAHPMIDNSLRAGRLDALAARPEVGVVLLDVVLGHGAHSDPASDLAPAIARVVGSGTHVVISLCGTAGDPQDLRRQAEILHSAGAAVLSSNAAAARHATRLTLDMNKH